METRNALGTASESSPAIRRGLRLGLFAGCAGAATALVILIGNTYTLNLPQVTGGKNDGPPPLEALARPGAASQRQASDAAASAVAAAGAAGVTAIRSGGGGLSSALVASVQGVQDAVSQSVGASTAADAPAELTPASFQIDGPTGGGPETAAIGGELGFGGGADGFGPPTGGGGFLAAPNASGGGGPQPADSALSGLQPLQGSTGLTGPAPEPATWALLTLGLAGVGAALRGQRRRRAA